MDTDRSFFMGALLQLAAFRSEDSAIIAGWTENSTYMRLVDTDAIYPQAAMQIKDDWPKRRNAFSFPFMLRTLADDRLVGFAAIHSIEWNNASGLLSMGIGDPSDWGKGFGSDALELILRDAFDELNLYRLGLDVISYNERAIRTYRKAGFKQEGALR